MDMSNAFRSKSLVYRAVEDTDEDKGFLHSLWLDPQSLHQNRYIQLHQPISRHDFDAFHKAHGPNRLIHVLVCLPVDTGAQGSQEESHHDARNTIPIGFVNLHGVSNDSRHHRTHDIGILIAAKYRGLGYGSEAIRWILNWGFQTAGLHRIGLESASFNTGAIKLWKRLGFEQDGRDREALWINGGWHDEIRFSMLEHEWRAIVEKERDDNDK